MRISYLLFKIIVKSDSWFLGLEHSWQWVEWLRLWLRFTLNHWCVFEKCGPTWHWLILLVFLPQRGVLKLLLIIIVWCVLSCCCVYLTLRKTYKSMDQLELVLWINEALLAAAKRNLSEVKRSCLLEELFSIRVIIWLSWNFHSVHQLIPGIVRFGDWLVQNKPVLCPPLLPVHYI